MQSPGARTDDPLGRWPEEPDLVAHLPWLEARVARDNHRKIIGVIVRSTVRNMTYAKLWSPDRKSSIVLEWPFEPLVGYSVLRIIREAEGSLRDLGWEKADDGALTAPAEPPRVNAVIEGAPPDGP